MTIATVAAAWNTAVLTNATITNYGGVLQYEHTELAETEVAPLMHNREVAFWECLITETLRYIELGNTSPQHVYDVVVRFTKEKDVNGTNHTDVRDALSAALSLVDSALGISWGGSVDYYTPPTEAYTIGSVIVADVDCWRGEMKFQGIKF